jgi:hypothetical protein
MKIKFFLVVISGVVILCTFGCRQIPKSDGLPPTIKDRSLYEEYVEQFDFLYNKIKNNQKLDSVQNIKSEISRINQMDRALRQQLARKYRVESSQIDRIIFRVLDDKLKEKGWSDKGEVKKS